MWVDQPTQWDRLAETLSNPARWPLGLDSETFGQPDKCSPQWRARVQCWSIATRTERRHPRGYRVAQGCVLPREALFHPGLRALLERADVPKLAHNAPHDYHSLWNEGIRVAGLEDTLQWTRVALPALWCGYGLKDLEVHVLGKAARPTFKEVTALRYVQTVVRRKKERGCVCGGYSLSYPTAVMVDETDPLDQELWVPTRAEGPPKQTGCRARQDSDWFDPDGGWRLHTRVSWRRFTPELKDAVRQRDVSEMVPGCPGWDIWVAYALADAVGVLELADYLESRPTKWSAEDWPWNVKQQRAA